MVLHCTMDHCMSLPYAQLVWNNSQYRYSISQEICTRFVLCCALLWLYIHGFPISIRLTSLALWQSNDCPSASKATLMNMDKYFMWIIMNDCITTTKQSTTKPCAYFLGYIVGTIPLTYDVVSQRRACCWDVKPFPIPYISHCYFLWNQLITKHTWSHSNKSILWGGSSQCTKCYKLHCVAVKMGIIMLHQH